MTQSGGAKNTLFLVTLSNFQKSGRAKDLPTPPSPRSLVNGCFKTCIFFCFVSYVQYLDFFTLVIDFVVV